MELWPLFGLAVRGEGLEMRYPDDRDLAALAELALELIHAEDQMPFSRPWSDQPAEERARSVLQFNWRARAEWTPDSWHLTLVAVQDGVVVGTQGMHATKFPVTRSVESGSWLGRRYQGQGLGTRMRRAMLHLAFAGLGAREARSGAFTDNASSRRVSEKVGYREDGTEVDERRGEAATIVRFLMTRPRWEATARADFEVVGLQQCLSLFGMGIHGADEPLDR